MVESVTSRPPSGAALDVALWGRLVLAVVVVVTAYRTTFATLVETMQLDTPLAHLSLVPLISIALAVATRRRSAGPDIRDRQLDWIVGAPLVAVALFMNVVLPRELSWEFWVWRVDLLSLPLFVAGIVSLLFGVRALWKYRIAVLFLFLAWPYPYGVALDRWLGEFTGLTIDGLSVLLRPLPLAQKVANSESLFEVVYDGQPFRLSVASACSGANGLVGFLLVGGAFMLVVDGTRRRKIAWLASGAVLVWAFNLVRIMVIFWTARQWGEDVAIDGFHPYVGLVVFNISVIAMMATMRRFGLRFRPPEHAVAMRNGVPTRMTLPGRPGVAALAVGAAAIALASVNADLRDYDRVATSLGAPQLASFERSLEHPDGWQVRQTESYDWSQRFFGAGSEWTRYSYSLDPTFAGPRNLSASLPITADVITTTNRGSLSSYGVEQCYSFHGHEISDVDEVDLGSGVYGGLLTWNNPKKDLSWMTLYWHWPVIDGDSTRYERITLVMQSRGDTTFATATDPDDATPTQAFASSEQGTGQRGFLVEFGRELIAQRTTIEAS